MTIRNLFFSLLLLAIPDLKAFSQQAPSNLIYMHRSQVDNRSVFFNRKVINPSLSVEDTAKLTACFLAQDKYLGTISEYKIFEITAAGHIRHTSFGIDLGHEQDDIFKNQQFKINYGYGLHITKKSELFAGINFGLSRFMYDPWSIYLPGTVTSYSEWVIYPNLDVGVTYNWLNQYIGLSGQNLLKTKVTSTSVNSTYYVADKTYLINYYSRYRFGNKWIVFPELILISSSYKTSFLLQGNISYQNKFTAGFIFNKYKEANGMMFSVMFFKHIELGYLFEKMNRSFQSESLGTHTLTLKVLLN